MLDFTNSERFFSRYCKISQTRADGKRSSMPYVQLYLPGEDAGADASRSTEMLCGEAAHLIAASLGLRPSDVLVQVVRAERGSSRMAVGLIHGRSRPNMDGVTARLARWMTERLGVEPDAVLVRFERTDVPPDPV
jgi:hypothetical protein